MQQSDCFLGKLARLLAAHHQRADGFFGMNQRDEQARAIARFHDDVVDHGWRFVLQVAGLHRHTLLSQPADGVGEGGVLVADRRDQFLAHAVGRTQPEFTFRFIEYVDGAGLGAGKLGRLGDDRGEHGLKVKRRGHRLSDFAERSQFTDRLRKFMRALFDSLFEADCRLFLFRHELIEHDRIVAEYFDRSRHFADLIGATVGSGDLRSPLAKVAYDRLSSVRRAMRLRPT